VTGAGRGEPPGVRQSSGIGPAFRIGLEGRANGDVTSLQQVGIDDILGEDDASSPTALWPPAERLAWADPAANCAAVMVPTPKFDDASVPVIWLAATGPVTVAAVPAAPALGA